ncbi:MULTISPECIES: PepSY domain-containing protein [Bradyrhizobium]|uniref:PepSY domain-containing protein n=1 Tax=Bradyrhizobium TaxID=374 RepID=UPI001FCBFAB2|nr:MULTISPECIES: PepSY domain-containing protein [unclassified Bradyrhizobium]
MLAGVLLAPVPAAAGDHDRGAPDAVRRAVEAGEIKSLADILASLRGKLPGQIAGVEIERERGRWIYEFRVVDDKGRLYEAYVDARSGEIERIKEK